MVSISCSAADKIASRVCCAGITRVNSHVALPSRKISESTFECKIWTLPTNHQLPVAETNGGGPTPFCSSYMRSGMMDVPNGKCPGLSYPPGCARSSSSQAFCSSLFLTGVRSVIRTRSRILSPHSRCGERMYSCLERYMVF